jgi:glycerol-3-phosphate dehydrogenase (NAD(P)+)
MTTLAVLGAGSAGTALAQVAAGNGHSVRLWSAETAVLEEIRAQRTNSKYLPDVSLHEGIAACWGLADALAGAEIAIVSVPTHAVRAVVREAAPYLTGGPVVHNVAKGLEEDTDLRMSEVMGQELGAGARIASMGGPAIATEFAREVPTAVIVASAPLNVAAAVQQAFQNDHFKVEASDDMVGVELGATFKNVYAIAMGMCDGLGYGTNTKAFVATLAIHEMESLITALGGERLTVYGLAGLGDLLTTGYSPHSRNRTLGEKLCTDPNWQEFVRTHTVEGVAACRSAGKLAGRAGVRTPLLDVVRETLSGDKQPGAALRRFLRQFAYE